MGATGILLNPLGAPTLSVTYCAQDDIEAVWSIFGVAVRLDDDQDGYPEVNVQAVIEQATSQMNRFLFRRYSSATIATTTWAKWCCASMAAMLLARRRGNEIPASLEQEVADYREALVAISKGQEDLTADDGPAAPIWDETPAVSNLAIDGRWTRAKVRRVPSTSTGGPQNNNGRIQNNTVDYAQWE